MSKEPKTSGITVKKEEDFSEWYSQVITKSEFVDYTAVSGCFVFRPHAYAVWEKIVAETDRRLKELGVKNVYFPMFIPEKLLQKEATHVEGFAPEVAWVTQGGNTKLEERLAVRPTSETIMYDSYSKWVRSWRDLPIKFNQWNNVVRWEFKHPTPLVRTREFLWCEGHTAFATEEEALQEIEDMKALWKDVTENILALKGISGRKSEGEKFAGAVATYSIEYLLPNGRTAQGPDAHFDGQNFSKAFDITFLDRSGKKDYAWQNTWAITTRMMGLMIMTHGDDKGIILPPRLSPVQVVVVPITFGENKDEVVEFARKISESLEGFSVFLDDRDEYNPGWKFNEWELKGVPLRIEAGPKDLAAGRAVLVRRDSGEKKHVEIGELKESVGKVLEDIQQSLFRKSEEFLESNIEEASDLEGINRAISGKKAAKAFFCGSEKCDEKVKEGEGKSLCIDFEVSGECIVCGGKGGLGFFGKSY